MFSLFIISFSPRAEGGHGCHPFTPFCSHYIIIEKIPSAKLLTLVKVEVFMGTGGGKVGGGGKSAGEKKVKGKNLWEGGRRGQMNSCGRGWTD